MLLWSRSVVMARLVDLKITRDFLPFPHV